MAGGLLCVKCDVGVCVVLLNQQLLHSGLRSLVEGLQLTERWAGSLVVSLEVLKRASPFVEIVVFAENFLKRIHNGNLRVDE